MHREVWNNTLNRKFFLPLLPDLTEAVEKAG